MGFTWPTSCTRLVTALAVAVVLPVMAYDLDPDSPASVKTIAKQMADDMLSFYHGDEPGHTPGLLPDPYYWWEAGAMLGALVEYWFYTGDDAYVDLTQTGLLHQVGEYNDYMPLNQTRTEGNDDQGFWGLAVMSAAEYNFPHAQPDEPQWLALAQAVFNTQAARWDTQDCGGGLRWQIFSWNTGYDYKNSISQACFFALGARLALYTGNQSYADWADKTWDWMMGVKFIDDKWYVYDGAHIPTNCTNIAPYQFTYNAGGFILGAAAMYNFTEDQVWKDRLDNLLQGAKVFFTGPDKNIMEEVACEPVDRCNLDQQSFKAYLSRWLATITKWAPHTRDFVLPYLRASAVAAAKQCVGGTNQRMCGLKWNQDKYDGSTGVGQQMAAMEVTLSCMIDQRKAALTADTGGTSKGNPGGGGDDIGPESPTDNFGPITAGDRAGAAFLTMSVIIALITGIIWMLVDEMSPKSAFQQVKAFLLAAFGATAAGGAAAAAIVRRGENDGDVYDEKGKPVVKDFGATPSTPSGSDVSQFSDKISYPGQAHTVDATQQRRLSNMPRGWPNNPSLRTGRSGEARVFQSQSMREITTVAENEPTKPKIRLPPNRLSRLKPSTKVPSKPT
ncbi:glycoside hydrolase family 76 protein [Paramyrothecium foliicola]|nr:glycoside hydrolase family 76 protein [Paramyrothecium foliicola]